MTAKPATLAENAALIRLYVIALLTVSLLPAACLAQDMDTAVFNSLHWRLIGSFRAGRVSAVAGVPDNPNIYYFGTPGGGIWKTTNAGHVWSPIFDQEHVASIGALAVAPSDSNIIYAGTGEQTAGHGVYRSNDQGKTWTQAGLADVHFIQGVVVDPKNPDILIVGANSIGVNVFSRPAPVKTYSLPRGIFKSLDGGKTWKQTLANDKTAGVFDLEVDSDNPRVLYASLFIPAQGPSPSSSLPAPAPQQTQANQGGRLANSLLYQSTDEGSTWHLLAEKGLPEKDRGRLGLSVAPHTNGKRIYAVMDQGFYRSDDAGATWMQSTKDPRIVGSGYFSRIFTDTQNPDTLYVAQTSLYRSTDGGHTFEAYVGAPSGDDFHVLWIDPQNSRRMLLGVDQGAILSVDAGQTWSSWYNQPTGQFYHVITDHAFPYRTYAAQQDSGTQSVPSRSDYGEITQQEDTPIGGFEFCFIAPDPIHPDHIYSGGWYGTVVRFDRKTGQTATVFEKGTKYRVVQMPPLLYSPHDPQTLYLGTQYVMRTNDEGKSWQEVSPDLTEWNNIDESQGNPDKPRPPAIEALAISPIDAGQMWAATSNRLVQLTRDGGAHWQKVTPPGISAPYEILYVEPSHHSADTAYLTIGSSRQALPPQVLRTHDFGATWHPIIQGLSSNESVRLVREDSVRKGLLFAGTDSSVYISFDNGDHWHSLNLNLPATPVTDMEVHGDDLVISTYGRGLWILDDITPIRQLTPELLNARLKLLKPADGLRVRWDTNQDTPLPIETPSAKNPPDGVGIDYYLRAPLKEEASITIKDAQGKVVRKFTGTGKEPNLPLPNVPEYWFGKPASVDKTAGLHRFIWDLRYDSPKTLPAAYAGPILQYTEYTLADHAIPHATPRQQPEGPLVVPGQYSVEFTGGGETVQQPLTVTLDPRVHTTQEDLQAQLALARRILSGIQISYDEYQKLKTIRATFEETRNAHPAEAAEAEKQLKALEEGTKAAPGFGPVNRDLVRLLNSVEGGDQRPTSPQFQAVDEVCDSLMKVMQLWSSFNGSLHEHNPLSLPIATAPAAAGCKSY